MSNFLCEEAKGQNFEDKVKMEKPEENIDIEIMEKSMETSSENKINKVQTRSELSYNHPILDNFDLDKTITMDQLDEKNVTENMENIDVDTNENPKTNKVQIIVFNNESHTCHLCQKIFISNSALILHSQSEHDISVLETNIYMYLGA